MRALCLSLIISLIISQIRSKYFNSFLINCAPQGVWRPAGLAIRVEGTEHKCKKMHIWCYLLNEQCRKTWGSGLLEAIFPLIKFTFLNQFSVEISVGFLSFITFECGNICNHVGYQCTFSVLAAHVNDNCRKWFLWNICTISQIFSVYPANCSELKLPFYCLSGSSSYSGAQMSFSDVICCD